MKKSALATAVLALAVGAFAATPKYVFLFIGDGMSVPQRMTAEEFSRKTGGGPLAMNAMPFSAMTRTCSATALVTDSAAAATAIACGVKTYNGAIGVGLDKKPVASCAEMAKKAGRKVGIVTTTTITHATPAGFYAHRANRGDTYGIALDLADSGFDFFAGGGLAVKSKTAAGHAQYASCGKADDYIRSRGYRIVRSMGELMSLKPGDGKILAMLADDRLAYAIDSNAQNPTHPETISKTMEPREGFDRAARPMLADMVSKAIEMLDGDAGFFMMVEGGCIDWACHANDAATNLRDILAMDSAVKVACAFREKHPDDTLIVVTGDHETGGMSMGFAGTGYAIYTERLTNQVMSVNTFANKVTRMFMRNPDLKFDDVKPLIREAFGLKFEGSAKKDPMVLTKGETADIKKAFDHDIVFHKAKVEENTKYDGEKRYLLGGACRLVLSHKCGIGWSSGAHTAMPTLTTAIGCGAEGFTGFMENSDIAGIIKGFYE